MDLGSPALSLNQNEGGATGIHRTSSPALWFSLGVPEVRTLPAAPALWGPELCQGSTFCPPLRDQDWEMPFL